jgi:hypothetical protein
MFGFGTLPVAANRIVIKQLGFCPGLLEEEGLLSVYESGGVGVAATTVVRVSQLAGPVPCGALFAGTGSCVQM